MDLLDQVTDKIKEMKADGIALSSVRYSREKETVEVVVGSIEVRDIFESGKDTNPAKSSEDDDLDLYHIR